MGTIELPSNLTSIGNTSFGECTSLTAIKIPDKVKSIGDKAFIDCENLSSLNLGSNLTSIGESAFSGCVKLPEVTIPSGVTTITKGTFENCNVLSKINFGPCVTTISDRAFNGCSLLETLTIPYTIDEIGENAFGGCDGLKFLTFEDSDAILRYGSGNFTTSPIERLTLGRTIQYTSNNTGAFSESSRDVCTLKRVEISSCVTSLPKAIFKGCKALATVIIAEGLNEIGDNAFESCEALISIKLPSTVNRMLANSFAKCFYLTGFDVPKGVSVIETQTFYQCRYITSVDLSNVVEIKNGAFTDCDRLEKVTLSTKLKSIGNNAFATCLALKSIELPASLTKIGSGAFFESSLNNIVSLAVVPPRAVSDTWSQEIYNEATVEVPSKAYDAYTSAEGWQNFNNFTRAKTYSVDVISNGNGTVLLNDLNVKSLELKENESLTISATPATGMEIQSASYTMGRETKSFSNSVTIRSVTDDVTVNVTFVEKVRPLPTGIKFTENSYGIAPGKSIKLSVEFAPVDAYSPVSFKIISGSEFISLNVDIVTGIKNGVAVIEATTENGLKAQCDVAVNDGSVYIKDPELSEYDVYEPFKCQLVGAGNVDPSQIKWSSSNENVIKVFDDGTMMMMNSNWERLEATITAKTPSGFTASITLDYQKEGTFSFDYQGYHYRTVKPFVVEFSNSRNELSDNIDIKENITFEGYKYTIEEVELINSYGEKLVAVTIPATVNKVNIESNFVNKIICYAPVPPKGNILLFNAQKNFIYVPSEYVSAYQSSRPWSSYIVKPIGHNIVVTANDGGCVIINGAEETDNTHYFVAEGKQVDITVQPNTGKKIKAASYTMGSQTVNFDRFTTIKEVTSDVNINVEFEDEPVVKPDPDPNPGENETVTFDFTSPENLTPAQTVSSNNSPVCEVDGEKFTERGVSLVANDGGTSARLWAYNSSYQLRIYNGATLTLSISEKSDLIKKVVVNGSQLDALSFGGEPLSDIKSVELNFAGGVHRVELKCVTKGSHKRADITSVKVVYGSSSGIGDVTVSDNEGENVSVFNLQGVKVSNNIENLSPGIYVVRKDNKVSKIVVK